MSIVQEAIHSRGDDAEIMLRADQCLGLYFQPDEDEKAKLAVRQAFVIALESVPSWAMHKAFDEWIRTGTRRPSPAEIRILADRALEPFARELKARLAAKEPPPPLVSPEDMERRRAFASRVMAELGYSKAIPRDKSTPPRQDVTPEEIAETMAEVNARSAEREAERERRAAVADDLARMGLSDGVARK